MVVWGRLAETLASYASKGSLISLDGELRTRKYDKDGQTHYVTEVLCSSFQLLESRAQRAVRENNLIMTWLTSSWKKNFPSSLSFD